MIIRTMANFLKTVRMECVAGLLERNFEGLGTDKNPGRWFETTSYYCRNMLGREIYRELPKGLDDAITGREKNPFHLKIVSILGSKVNGL